MTDVTHALSDLVLPESGPLFIACAREVIGINRPQPLSVDALRGVDRDLADVLVEEGFNVCVRACLVAKEIYVEATVSKGWDMTAQDQYFARLREPFTIRDVEQLLDAVTFVPAWGDGGGYDAEETSDLSDRCDVVPSENWLVRPGSIATYLTERDFAEDGYVGNAAEEAYLYRLAALEVTNRTSHKA